MMTQTSEIEALAFWLGQEEYGVDIRPAPEMGSAFDTEFLLGLGTVDERMLILLDIERLMSSEELGLIERLAA